MTRAAFAGMIALVLLFSMVFSNIRAFGEEKIALSLSACLDIGLANNLDIKIAKLGPLIENEGVRSAKSIYDTIIESSVSYEDDRRARVSTIAGSKSLENNYKLGASTKMPISGTELDLDYSDKREWTDSVYAVNNPLHTSELSLTVTQPVLKNFFGFVDRADVRLSKIDAELAGIESLDKIEDVVADIEKAYWRLVFAEENIDLRKRLFEQSNELYKIFEEHLKTGLAETTELYEIEANMRIRKAELMVAENDLITASNNLKLFLNEGGDFLIAPGSALIIFGEKIGRAASLKNAFDINRDYSYKKKELTSKKIKVKMKKNSLWPEVDLVGTFAINGVDRKLQKATGKLTTDKHSMFYGGIEVTVPLENREAQSAYNKADLEKEKAILELLQTEKEILTDIDEKVRKANLSLENAKRWTKIKQIEERKFKDEEKKMKYGRSNSKTIIDYQNDLTRANLSEYTAILDYYLALIDLENAKDTLLAKVGVLKQ